MDLELTFTINAPITLVWEALVDPTHIEQWGAGPAVMSDESSSDFSLWGGEIYGNNIEIVTKELIKQEWYAGDWEEPSLLTITLTPKTDTTIIDLYQTHIPEDSYESIKEGWNEQYMEPLAEYVEDIYTSGDLEGDEIFLDEEI